MRLTRASASKKRASIAISGGHSSGTSVVPKPTFHLKEGGIFTDNSRAMVRDLVAKLDVPIASVNSAIEVVANTMGVQVEGSVSSRTARRIVMEGGVAVETQLVDEIGQSRGRWIIIILATQHIIEHNYIGLTLSGDGTTHKNINYQSHHITYHLPDGEVTTRFAGILHEVNHTSETQLSGWKKQIASMYKTYNEVQENHTPVDPCEFVSKTKGMLTDHAEDQKKLTRLFVDWKHSCEREVRGERVLAALPPVDLLQHLCELSQGLLDAAGGSEGWDSLTADEKRIRSEEALHQLRIRIGEEQFTSLSDSEKKTVDFFIWAGCTMHKELNATKGGNSRIRSWWAKKDIEGPVLLMNKDNAAVTAMPSSGESSKAKERAVQVSTGGGQKVLDLAGAVFRHKDDKHGQQDSIHYYLEAELGFRIQWPDTSNTRYHSHGDAACEFLVHESSFLSYLEIMKVKKDSRTLTNIEENVYRGFSCPKTKEEIACWAAYNQCITHPYLRMVRNSSINILDLGPVHTRLVSHLQNLITNPDLVLAPSASHETAALDSRPFERPEAFYAIQRVALDEKTYPHLQNLLKEFLEGALDTWIRFCSEFAPGGTIDLATPAQKKLAHMKTTNDDNEGALGTVRTSLRRAPNMSLSHFNSRFMYKKNDTGTYITNAMGPNARKNLRSRARAIDVHGDEHLRRKVQVEYDKSVAQRNEELDLGRKERKEASRVKMANLKICTNVDDVPKLRVTEIDLQIRWHRQFDTLVPAAKDTPKKKEGKVEILQEAVKRYIRGEAAPGESSSQSRGEDTRKGDSDNEE